MPSLTSHPRLTAQAQAKARRANRLEKIALGLVLIICALMLGSCTPRAYSLTTQDAQHLAPAQVAAPVLADAG
ncbi:hypothetical protein [Hymenobacter glacieicola]|uniref:Uncharacterized protein n=1 Tax=Hymenobacter glacieicola TaxID=1562124 RepID=A0ABQ1WK26_9BACT|nr:hypothetical protein [Hymenobacter glacieicola]GGG33933.1 hypothetical protein GCM10011378_07960 [Hymenobacter glacieicola]